MIHNITFKWDIVIDVPFVILMTLLVIVVYSYLKIMLKKNSMEISEMNISLTPSIDYEKNKDKEKDYLLQELINKEEIIKDLQKKLKQPNVYLWIIIIFIALKEKFKKNHKPSA